VLTEKARYERMWGWIPTLGTLLAGKRMPDRYFGYSSVSDNTFDSLTRLMKISILIHENFEDIKREVPTNPRLQEELYSVAQALKGVAKEFQEQSARLDERIRSC
jgi:hypothetical protein